jgi:hypothetical protein
VFHLTNEAKSRIYRSGTRHSLYLPAGIISDSTFPFRIEDELLVRIEKERLVIERKKSK